MPPREAPEKKFSFRDLRSPFRRGAANGDKRPPVPVPIVDPEKPHGRPSDPFNPYDLIPSNNAGLPYPWNTSPNSPQGAFPSPVNFQPRPQQERELPLPPQSQPLPQITVINVDKPPTPPPVLPPVANVSSVDLPWSNSRPSTASPESAAPEQPPSLEMQPTSLSTELIPVVAAESQMIVYAGEHTA